MIDQRIRAAIRDIPDFPKPGIIFKDITPILQDPALCGDIVDELVSRLSVDEIDVVAGIESRGFLFGLILAQRLGKPFIPIRKQGKLPYRTIKQEYTLEYGTAAIEVHEDAFPAGSRVLIHDDLLATGGTIEAANRLVGQLRGRVVGYAFIISLDFLGGKKRLEAYNTPLTTLIDY
jgi:adenine phosphoribosyltransferase